MKHLFIATLFVLGSASTLAKASSAESNNGSKPVVACPFAASSTDRHANSNPVTTNSNGSTIKTIGTN